MPSSVASELNMATVAVNAHTTTSSRRKPTTYGRKKRAGGRLYFSDDGDKATERPRDKPQPSVRSSTVPKSDGNSFATSSPALAPSIFDVVSSDEDHFTAKVSPRPDARSTQLPPSKDAIFEIQSSEEEALTTPSRSPTRKIYKDSCLLGRYRDKHDKGAGKAYPRVRNRNVAGLKSPSAKKRRIENSPSREPASEGTRAEGVSIRDLALTRPKIEKEVFEIISSSPPVTPPRKVSGSYVLKSSFDGRESQTIPPVNGRSTPKPNYQLLGSVTPKARRQLEQLARSSASPASSQSQHGSPITTPRQNEAWGRLLYGDLESTPVKPMASISLRSAPATQARFSNGSVSTSSASTPRRRRLIDKLQSPEPELVPIVEGSKSQNLNDNQPELFDPRSTEAPATTTEHLLLETGTQQRRTISTGRERTYAGGRNYRVQSADPIDQLLSQSLEEVDSSSALHRPDDIMDDEENAAAIKSVHELRAAGDSRSFEDEMSSVIQDLERQGPRALSAKRAALMDLCSRLDHEEFRNRFVTNGHDSKVFKLCVTETDIICSSLTAAAILLLLRGTHQSTSAIHIHQTSVLATLITLLDHDRSISAIGKDRKSNISKVGQVTLANMQQEVQNSDIWMSPPSILTPRLLTLHVHCTLFTLLRQAGVQDTLLSSRVVDKLLDLLKQLSEAASLHHLEQELILLILEACTAAPRDDSIWTETRLQLLSEQLDHFLGLSADGPAQKLQQVALRLYTNLGNNSEQHSNALVTPNLIQHLVALIGYGLDCLKSDTAGTTASPTFDTLLLALGALINLAEWSENVRNKFASEPLHIKLLTKAFVDSRGAVAAADTEETSRANVAYGYLAVLLCNLCQNPSVLQDIRTHLPKQNLESVTSAVQEFIIYHQQVDQREGSVSYAAFTTRLQSVLQSLPILDP